MGTEIFSVKHTAGKTVFFRFYDPVQGKMFDFDDDTWQVSPTTPGLAAVEDTNFGDADESIYVTAATSLTNMYNSAAPRELIAQAVDDLATDEIITEGGFIVSSGELVSFPVGGVLSELTTTPAATPTWAQAMMLLYQWLRNDGDGTATLRRIMNDAGSAISEATMADDGTTFNQGKLADP